MNPSLKNPSKGGWKSTIFIIFLAIAERFSYFGIAANLIIYLTTKFNQPTDVAAKSVNNWMGASAIFPVLGGFLADSYVGRFNMIVPFTGIYLFGLILLTVAVTAVPLQVRETVFFLALYILSIGEGGHRPCVQTFAVDQFDDTNPEEKAAKSSFFNWWFAGTVMGATVSVLVVPYIETSIGWGIGYGILSASIAITLTVFLLGTKRYHREKPAGSSFTKLAQVIVAAVRKRGLPEKQARGICDEIDENEFETLARTTKFRFLDKASLMDGQDASEASRNPWRLCPINEVEETKLVLQLIPVWLTCLMYAVVNAQLNTYFTKQASTVRRNLTSTFQILPASFLVVPGIAILIAMPIYDRAFVPLSRRLTGHPTGITMLQRIGLGLVLIILTMIIAALSESKRVRIAKDHGLLDEPGAIVPMSAWWLIPQYTVLGMADVLTMVGLQELFYDQMPIGMRSIGASASIIVTGFGNILSSGLISIVNWISRRMSRPWLRNNINQDRLEDFYWLLAGLSAISLCAYVWVASRFKYKEIGLRREVVSSDNRA